MQEDTARHIVVDGHVQGVGFRAACAQQARMRHLNGWVRNMPDGRVEAWVEGPSGTVGEMIDWLSEGPPGARVSERSVTEQQIQHYPSFTIQH